jgi:hypothetical protein
MSIIHILAACLAGVNLTAPISFSAGPPVSTMSTFNASPNTLVANGSTQTTLTLVARDLYGNPSPGVAISLSVTGSNNSLKDATGSTDISGTFTTGLASTTAETKSVQASWPASSGNTLTTNVQFVPGPASAATSSLAVSPNQQIANNSNTIRALLTLRDVNNNAIVGVTPSFTASGVSTSVSTPLATDFSGQSYALFQTSLAQNENVLVLANGYSTSMAVRFVAGPPTAAASTLSASPNNLPGNGAASSTLSVVARDAQGNPVSGASVALSGSGTGNTFYATSGTTNSSGNFSTTLRSSTMQTETISATLNGNVTVSTSVLFTGPASAANSSLVVNPNSQSVDNGNALVATLTLRDSGNNPIYNVTPTWAASGTKTNVTSSGSTTNAGVASATYQSTVAQNENAKVQVGGISLSAPFIYLAGSPNSAQSEFVAIPKRQVANNSNVIIGSLILRDKFRNGVPGQNAVFATGSGSTSVTNINATTDSTGTAQASYKTNTIQNANATVSVASLNYSTSLIFTDIPASCALSINPNSGAADGNTSMLLTATVTNASSAAVSNVEVIFSSAGGAGPLKPYSAVSNASGQAIAHLTSFSAGSNKVSAQAASVQCTAQGNFLSRTSFCTTGNPNYTTTSIATAASPRGVAVADLNKDGKLDLAVANASGAVSVYLNTAGGTFTNQGVYSTGAGTQPQNIIVADLNGDGNQDLALNDYSGNTLNILLGAGGGVFGPPVTYATAVQPSAVVAGDFNGDGTPDIAMTNLTAATVSVFIGTGSGTFLSPVSYAAQYQPSGLALGDFNKDGIQDLAVANANAKIGIYLGTGTGTFSGQVLYSGRHNANSLAVGDFDGDGNQDLAITDDGTNQLFIGLGTGAGSFQTFVYYAAGQSASALVVADFNGDGLPDIAVGNYSDNTVGIFLGSGSGTFAAQVTHVTGSLPLAIGQGDFNGDGKVDLVVTNFNDNTIGIMQFSTCN